VIEESQIEGCKHQDNTYVHHQPIPESIPKEQYIYTNDNGYQHHKRKARQTCFLSFQSPCVVVQAATKSRLINHIQNESLRYQINLNQRKKSLI
jgi:hypothetical protein